MSVENPEVRNFVISFIGTTDERILVDPGLKPGERGPLLDFLGHLLDPNGPGISIQSAVSLDNLMVIFMIDEFTKLEQKLQFSRLVREKFGVRIGLVNFSGTQSLGDDEFMRLKPVRKHDPGAIVDPSRIAAALEEVIEHMRARFPGSRILLHPTSGTPHVRMVMSLLPIKFQDHSLLCVEWPRDSDRFVVQDLGFIRNDLVRHLFPDVREVDAYDDPSDLQNQRLAEKYALYAALEFDGGRKMPTPVLITGPTGTGKEGLAEVIARFFLKKTGLNETDCLRLNCAALPDQLAESMLFGHRKGSFTGATGDHPGAFEKQYLFLDEIGDLSEAIQAKLLRVLESGRYVRLGETTERTSRAFVVAATNAPRKLRSDLLFRLAAFHLECLPLSCKTPLHRAGLVQRLIPAFATGGADVFDETAIDYLTNEPFSDGNYRELRGLIRRCVVFRDPSKGRITVEDLRAEHHKFGRLLGEQEASLDPRRVSGILLDRFLEIKGSQGQEDLWKTFTAELKAGMVREYALRRPGATRTQIADALGVTEKSISNWKKL